MATRVHASSLSSKPEDDRHDGNQARVTGATRSREVKFNRQTTARRNHNTKGLLHRDGGERGFGRPLSEDRRQSSPRRKPSNHRQRATRKGLDLSAGRGVASAALGDGRDPRDAIKICVSARQSCHSHSVQTHDTDSRSAENGVGSVDSEEINISVYQPGTKSILCNPDTSGDHDCCEKPEVVDNAKERGDDAADLEQPSEKNARFTLGAESGWEAEEDTSGSGSNSCGQFRRVSGNQAEGVFDVSPSSPVLPGSAVLPQFRRLESRRGSSVTFILPADVSSKSSSADHSIGSEEGAQFQERYNNLYARRMSAPELPPIVNKEQPRAATSYNQLTVPVNNNYYLSRISNPLQRNHSDSSLRALLTRSSASLNSLASTGGGFAGLSPPGLSTGFRKSSSRALSWCATDNSTGSLPKLETLFEGQIGSTPVNNGNCNFINSSQMPPTTPTPIPQTVTSQNHSHNNNRSVSVNGLSGCHSEELAKPAADRKRLQSDSGVTEQQMLTTIEQAARFKSGGMRRVASDNKLVDKKNSHNARLNSSRLLSVNRMDKLTPRRASNLSGVHAMRRVHSVSAINSAAPGRKTRLYGKEDRAALNGSGTGCEDSEEEERCQRIRLWLQELDCADAPPEPIIDYADDPPQTDTALHIVYQDDA